MTNIFNLDITDEEETDKTVAFTQYHYIATYIIDAHNLADIEILSHSFMTVRGDMDTDMYYSECAGNETIDELWAVVRTPHWDPPPGMYRIVVGAECDGTEGWTDCGHEYDAWQNYTLMSKYQLTENEIQLYWKGWYKLEDEGEVK